MRRLSGRVALAALTLLAACVPDLGRVLQDQGVTSVDDLPVWAGSEPTQIGIVDLSTTDGTTRDTKPDRSPVDLASEQALPDGPPPGKWYQANQKNCPTYCISLGKQNVPGPEGAHCMSGEVRSGSGIAQGITFPWGCVSGCLPMGPHQAESDGGECYKPGQKKDHDDTDRTVGCFCL